MPVSASPRPVELPQQPGAARRELARFLHDTHWPGDADGALLAVHEAMVNSQRHAGGVTRATAGYEGRSLVVHICDRGRGFDMPLSPLLADSAAEQGRGLFLIRHLASDAHVEQAGGDVSLVLTFAP